MKIVVSILFLAALACAQQNYQPDYLDPNAANAWLGSTYPGYYSQSYDEYRAEGSIYPHFGYKQYGNEDIYGELLELFAAKPAEEAERKKREAESDAHGYYSSYY